MPSSTPIHVAAFYRFAALSDADELDRLVGSIDQTMADHGVRGTVILAHEGINGTIAGPEAGVEAVLDLIQSDERLAHLPVRRSTCAKMPIARRTVKVRDEIVTMGVPGIDPEPAQADTPEPSAEPVAKPVAKPVAESAPLGRGTYVPPEAWDDLLKDPDVAVVDTRNQYETRIGIFPGAIDPGIETFSEFPDWADANLDPTKHKAVAMYCTGGIRCEKSTAYLRARGFEKVYHLQGGILAYLEQIAPEQSTWDGACFVFDQRVSVGHGLEQQHHALCPGCGGPTEATSTTHVDPLRCEVCRGKEAANDKDKTKSELNG